MTSAQTRVGETIDNFYGDSSEAAIASNSYKRAVEELDEIAIRELVSPSTLILHMSHGSLPFCFLNLIYLNLFLEQDTPYRSTVLEPVGRFCSYFTEINSTLAKRHKKVSK
jgi:amphiphysin